MMTPGSSSDVFHIRLTPCGAFIATVVMSAGSRKCGYRRGGVPHEPVGLVDVRGVTDLVAASRVDPKAGRDEQRTDDVAYIVMARALDNQPQHTAAPRLLR